MLTLLRVYIVSLLAVLVLASCTPPITPPPLPVNAAVAFRWGSYVDTDLELSSFYALNHTVSLHFMAQYERAYEGPLLANTGSGSYLVELGDYAAAGNRPNLFLNINGKQARYLLPTPATYPADFPDFDGTTSAPAAPVLQWHHLALVRDGNTLAVWLDAQRLLPMGSASDLQLPSGSSSGKLRLGKRVIGALERETQFYGFIDNLAVFDYAFRTLEIVNAMGQGSWTGKERGMIFGTNFQRLPADIGSLWASPYRLEGSSYLAEVSGTLHGAQDTMRLPLPITYQIYHLPFKRGEIWQVLQAYNSYGSHGSYAAFSWDFTFVPNSAPRGQPVVNAADTEGRVFVAATGNGTVAEIAAGSSVTPTSASFVLVTAGADGFHGYLHFKSASLTVAKGDRVREGMELAQASNVGGGGPHLHFAVTNLPESRHREMVTIPIYFAGYEASDDYGKTWHEVSHGMPRVGQWIRHFPPPQ